MYINKCWLYFLLALSLSGLVGFIFDLNHRGKLTHQRNWEKKKQQQIVEYVESVFNNSKAHAIKIHTYCKVMAVNWIAFVSTHHWWKIKSQMFVMQMLSNYFFVSFRNGSKFGIQTQTEMCNFDILEWSQLMNKDKGFCIL